MTTENSSVSFSSVFLVKVPPTNPKITALADWGKKLRSNGLVQGIEGNVSFRTGLGFIISGTEIALDALTPDNVSEITGVVYGLNKTSVYVKGLVIPSRETILHAQIYDARQDVNAIFHVHDVKVLKQAEALGIPVTAREQEPGSLELAKEAMSLLSLNKDVRYFVLRNHGGVALGTSMDEAGNLLEGMVHKAYGK